MASFMLPVIDYERCLFLADIAFPVGVTPHFRLQGYVAGPFRPIKRCASVCTVVVVACAGTMDIRAYGPRSIMYNEMWAASMASI